MLEPMSRATVLCKMPAPDMILLEVNASEVKALRCSMFEEIFFYCHLPASTGMILNL